MYEKATLTRITFSLQLLINQINSQIPELTKHSNQLQLQIVNSSFEIKTQIIFQ